MKRPDLLALLKRSRQALDELRRRTNNQHSELIREIDLAIGYHEALATTKNGDATAASVKAPLKIARQ